jgi:integrase
LLGACHSSEWDAHIAFQKNTLTVSPTPPFLNSTVAGRSDMKIITSKPVGRKTVRPKRSNTPKQRAPRGAGSITQLESGKWQARVRRFGRDVKRTFDTQAEALQALETMRRATGTRNAVMGKMQFANWLERYRLEEAPKRKTRTRTLHEFYQSLAMPLLGRIPLSEITPADLREFQNSLLHYSASTQRQVWHFTAAALRRAFNDDFITANPAAKVDAPRGGSVAKRSAWTRDETEKALIALHDHRHMNLIAFMLTTGLRPGEALALRWQDISVTESTVNVCQTVERAGKNPIFTTPKTDGSKRSIYIDPWTLTMLAQHKEFQALERKKAKRWTNYDLVFPSSAGTPLDHRSMRRTMEFIATRAGVRHLTPHELRHTHRTLARLAGVSTKLVSSRMGHASESITEIYDHTHQDDLEQRNAAMPLTALIRIPSTSLTDHKTLQKPQIEPQTEALYKGDEGAKKSVSDTKNQTEVGK